MKTQAKLIVFEGPDGSGKSTLVQRTKDLFNSAGLACECMSFPGHEPGTLGHLVYRVHHAPDELGIKSVSPTSLQLLHVAAHIDLIERVILPSMKAGRWVLLDRFWWSTWVYGVTSGAHEPTLQRMIELESEHWGNVQPASLFLSLCTEPGREKLTPSAFATLADGYRNLAAQQAHVHPVHILEGNGSLEKAWGAVVGVLRDLGINGSQGS